MSRAHRSSRSALAAGEKYREVLTRADLVLSGLADGVTVQDAHGRLLYVNDAAAHICGFADAETMLATPPAEIMNRFAVLDEHGEPIDPDQLPGRRVLAGETPEPMLLSVRQLADGRTWWTSVRAHAIHDADGVPELAVNIWYDATQEQKQRTAARFLAEATSRLASSIDYAETLKAVAQALVPELADWCGVDLIEEGVSRSLAVAHADPAKVQMAAELRAKYPADPNATAGTPGVLRSGIAELYRVLPPELIRAGAKDEAHFRALMELGLHSLMIVPILVGGRAEGTLTLASAESRRSFDDDDLALACEIGRRAGTAIENARAYRSAKRAIRARDEFLAVAGHELRTPLAALMLQIESIRLAMDTGAVATQPERFSMRLDKTFGHALRLARLVDGLLDISRVAEGRVELLVEDVDVAALVRDTCDRFTEDATRAECELTVIAPVPCPGRFDAQRLEQVVSNLLSNAMKYGASKPITVRCEALGQHLVVSCEDHGIGIGAEDHERVFRRFERAVSERNYAGLGLGLWISRELVTAHGGTITLESELGRGSKFTVTLPLKGV
ncbi:MAG: Chemotaxis protein methyltransferase CheR [Myxococcaceae bacterium]|nr:Chemotaxis protein methyltransferase CheR [Myxococcaceae bacterium]